MPIVRSGYAPAGNRKRNAYGRSRKHWQTIRKQRLALDGHRCQLLLAGCTTTATTVHLHPSANGNHDSAHLGNTQSACAHCHGVIDGAGARR